MSYSYSIPPEVEDKSFPAIVHYLTGNDSVAYQSNCWNSTLLFHGVPINRRWEDGEDMLEWIQTNTYRCRYPLKYGDILYIHGSGRYDITHTAVYVGNGWYWHKDGPYIAEFATLGRVLRHYTGDYWHHRRVKKNANDISMLPAPKTKPFYSVKEAA